MKLTQKQKGGAHRKALIDSGQYSRPTHKVHKDKSKYNRKSKHKKSWD